MSADPQDVKLAEMVTRPMVAALTGERVGAGVSR